MATYAFETLTPEQALAVQARDTVTFTSGEANQATVLYLADTGQIAIASAGKSLTFAAAVAAMGSGAPPVAFTFPDASTLFIGGESGDSNSGSTNNDAAFGGAADDTLSAGSGGRDLLQGNAGADSLQASGGQATIYGGQGDDAVAGYGVRFVQGNQGADTIKTTGENMTVLGGKGDDYVLGSQGGHTNFINGNLGDDQIYGSGTLSGEDGADTIAAAIACWR